MHKGLDLINGCKTRGGCYGKKRRIIPGKIVNGELAMMNGEPGGVKAKQKSLFVS